MSSDDSEGSVSGEGLDPHGWGPFCDRQARPKAPRGPTLGLDLGTPTSSEGFDSETDGVETGRQVLWGCEGQPVSQADIQGHTPGHIAEEATMAVLQQPTDRDAQGVRRNPPAESCKRETSTMWVDLKLGPGGRGWQTHRWVGSQPLPSAGPRHPRGPEGGRPLEILKRGTKLRSPSPVCPQLPSMEGLLELPSKAETSDEIDITQQMKVTYGCKGRGQARPSILEGPRDAPRHLKSHARENFLHVPGYFMPSASGGPTWAVERQAGGEGDVCSWKKTPSMIWGQGESRPSYQGAAAPGHLPEGTYRKSTQGKPALGGVPNLALERSFPSCGQKMLTAPLEPVTLPTISGAPTSGRSKRSSWGPSGIRQPRHGGSRKRSSARKAREFEGVGAEDKDPKKDPGPKDQPPAPKPGASCVCGHRGEFSSGNYNIRPPIIARRPQPLALSKEDVVPKGPGPSGDQAPPDSAPRLDRQPELPPGAEGCPRCPVLQREVDSLREKLGAMEALAKKFQSLSS